MNCEECEKKIVAPVPYVAFETSMGRMAQANKHATVVIIVLIFALLISWIGFFIHESQHETVSETTQEVWQDADGNSINRFIGGDNYGGTSAHQNSEEDVSSS